MTAQPTAPKDWWYVDVAAVRIQTWLGRSATLRYRRGASYRLQELTSKESVAGFLRTLPNSAPVAHPEWNQEAGEISGVASVRFPAEGVDDGQARALAAAVAVHISNAVRRVFPAAGLEATWGKGASYVEARAEDFIHRRQSEGLLIDVPAHPDEGFLARPCQMCRRARAVHAQVQVIADEEGRDLCQDCHSRVEATKRYGSAAGYSSASDQDRRPKAQRRLDEGITVGANGSRRYPSDFTELAAAIGKHEGDAATQIATLYADANQMGAALRRWVANGGIGPDKVPIDKSSVVAHITQSTQAALTAGARLTASLLQRDVEGADLSLVPVLVHIADGDDILVSVPASAGWVMARAVASTFTEELTKRLGQSFADVTISSGMVFHHSSHPIADVIDRADRLLRVAKRSVRGKEAAIAFLDLTADGESSEGVVEPDLRVTAETESLDRPAIRMQDLCDWAGVLDDACEVDPAHRATLTQLLRESAAAALTPEVSPRESARAALARRVETLGDKRILAIVQSEGGQEGIDGLGAENPASRNRLRLLLDVARWWAKSDLANESEGARDN